MLLTYDDIPMAHPEDGWKAVPDREVAKVLMPPSFPGSDNPRVGKTPRRGHSLPLTWPSLSVLEGRSQLFLFEDTNVRIVVQNGEPWLSRSRRSLVLADVCRVLDVRTDNAARGLDDDEKGHSIVGTPGGPQKLIVVNESGLYNVIFLSRKNTARRFRKWVTSEVLPMIRKTGMYVTQDYMDREFNNPGFLRDLLSKYAERVLEMQPKADFFPH